MHTVYCTQPLSTVHCTPLRVHYTGGHYPIHNLQCIRYNIQLYIIHYTVHMITITY